MSKLKKVLTTGTVIADPTLGSELITTEADRDFSSDSGNWTGDNWAIGSNVFTHTAGDDNATLAGVAAEAGKNYLVTLTIVTTTAGVLKVSLGGTTAVPDIGAITGTLTAFRFVIKAVSTAGLVLIPDGDWAGTIDNVSIKEITSPVGYVTNLKVSRSLSKVDLTDTETSGSFKEYLAGREETTFSFDMFMGVNEDDFPTGAVTDLEISFEGKKYKGSGILEKMDADGSIDAGITQSYSGSFSDTVTVIKVS